MNAAMMTTMAAGYSLLLTLSVVLWRVACWVQSILGRRQTKEGSVTTVKETLSKVPRVVSVVVSRANALTVSGGELVEVAQTCVAFGVQKLIVYDRQGD